MRTSHSKTKTARRCLKAYQYKYVYKIRKRLKSRPLIVGGLIHSCIESYFKGNGYLPTLRNWVNNEYKALKEGDKAELSDVESLVKVMMRGYIKSFKLSGLTPLWVEKEFSVQLTDDIELIGKIDMLAECSRGLKWLVEHKTCKRMPGEEFRMNDTQAILYVSVLPSLGENDNITGVVWDYLRTKSPAIPTLLKSGGLSTNSKIDTTPEVYRNEVLKHGLDPAHYSDIMDELENKRDQFFRQIRLPISNMFSVNVMNDLIKTNEHLIYLEDSYGKGNDLFTRNLNKDCSWCDYLPLCHSEMRGEDTSFIMKHDYIRRKDEESKEEISIGED